MLFRQIVATLDVVQIRFWQIQFLVFIIVGARYRAIEYGAKFRLNIFVGRHKTFRFDEFADQFLVLAFGVALGQRRRIDGADFVVEGEMFVEEEFTEAFHVIVAAMRHDDCNVAVYWQGNGLIGRTVSRNIVLALSDSLLAAFAKYCSRSRSR